MGLGPSDSEAGRAYQAMRSRSAWDVVVENFKHPVTRRVLSWMGFATFQPPKRSGTGFLPISILNGRIEYGWATPVGGSAALPNSLVRLIRDHGGTVLIDSPVSRILVENGRATGVVTEDGRRFVAQHAVVSSAHIKSMSAMLGSQQAAELAAAGTLGAPASPCSQPTRHSSMT